MLLYIHGFNSNACSNTFRMLREHFPEAQALEYPSHGHFDANLHSLRQQAERHVQPHGSAPVLVGSSLGGFYASQLAALLGCNCALFNPAVYPQRSLQKFLGPNVHFYTQETWFFTEESLLSYAHFPDTRKAPLRRFLLLGRKDSLLDPQEARNYWQGCAHLHLTDDEHSLKCLDTATVETLRLLLSEKP